MTHRTERPHPAGTMWICENCGRTMARKRADGLWAPEAGDADIRTAIDRRSGAVTGVYCGGCGATQNPDVLGAPARNIGA